VAELLAQLCGALSEVHARGLIHRDVKPANVILVPERGGAPDVAKVVDFGLVKALDRTGPGELGLTQDDHIAGTPLYLSPEAITAPERVDPRSDLYSLGCVGYYLLTGQRVFEGRNVVEVCSHHLHTPPTAPSARLGRPVPESLSTLLLACLEKERERRPASARELLLSLDSCRDVPAWTEEEARAWWSARAVDPGGPPTAPASVSSVGTLSIIRRAEMAPDV
jgi:serine/threonine-protein kinase